MVDSGSPHNHPVNAGPWASPRFFQVHQPLQFSLHLQRKKGYIQLQLGGRLPSAVLVCALVATMGANLEGTEMDPQCFAGASLSSRHRCSSQAHILLQVI